MEGYPDKAGEVCRIMKVGKNSVPNGTKAWKGVDAGIVTDQRVILTSSDQIMISCQVETEVGGNRMREL